MSSDQTFDEFMTEFHGSQRTVATVDVHDPDSYTPFIVLQHGTTRVVINPIVIMPGTPEEYLDVDVHAFKDGQRTPIGVMAMRQGLTWQLPFTGLDVQGRPATELIALFVDAKAEDPRYGHCDTCGAPCNDKGCTVDQAHVAALDPTDARSKEQVRARLEYLRGEIRAERISQGEIAELVDLADHIESGDVELAEWAGIDEQEFLKR